MTGEREREKREIEREKERERERERERIAPYVSKLIYVSRMKRI